MTRAILSVSLCLVVLGLGFYTACYAAENRARSAQLDARQRWCETYSRQNKLLQSEVLRLEWQLLSTGETEGAPAAASSVEVSE